jgi:NADH-quinone oxidoreductase subunit N
MSFYVLMNIGAFFAVIWIRERTGSDLIDDYQGMGYRAPLVCIAFTICLFSLTGLPPLAGFIGKYYLFSAALERAQDVGVVSACLPAAGTSLGFAARINCAVAGSGAYYWLALIGLLNSAVSLYYYARVVKKMFLEKPADESLIPVDFQARGILVTISALLVVGGIYWVPLWNAVENAIEFRRPTIAEVRPGPTPSMVGKTGAATIHVARTEGE